MRRGTSLLTRLGLCRPDAHVRVKGRHSSSMWMNGRTQVLDNKHVINVGLTYDLALQKPNTLIQVERKGVMVS